MTSKRKSYRELRQIQTFDDRYDYLKLRGEVGSPTFGFDRYLNQLLYRSRQWKRLRDDIIVRDNGCDLGIDGYEIGGQIIIHHINPITVYDIESGDESVFDPEGLVCTSPQTHLAIHYGDKSLLISPPVVRYSGDTTPWR